MSHCTQNVLVWPDVNMYITIEVYIAYLFQCSGLSGVITLGLPMSNECKEQHRHKITLGLPFNDAKKGNHPLPKKVPKSCKNIYQYTAAIIKLDQTKIDQQSTA